MQKSIAPQSYITCKKKDSFSDLNFFPLQNFEWTLLLEYSANYPLFYRMINGLESVLLFAIV